MVVVAFPEQRNVNKPSAGRSRKADPAREGTVWTPAEVRRLIDATKKNRMALRDRALLTLCFGHGLRVSEVIEMRRVDLRINEARISIRREKGGISADHPLSGGEQRALRAWLRTRVDDHPNLFVTSTGAPLSRFAVNRIVERAAAEAGLPGRAYPHALRHSTGAALANAGYDIRHIAEMLGHKSMENSRRYTRLAPSRLEVMSAALDLKQ